MIRTFRAPTIRDAMKIVKQQLGENAVILQTRKAGSAKDELVEVDAMSGQSHAAQKSNTYSPATVNRPRSANSDFSREIREELRKLREVVSNIPSGFHYSNMIAASEPFRTLIKTRGLDEEVAVDLAEKINFIPDRNNKFEIDAVTQSLRRAMSGLLETDGNLGLPRSRPKLVYLVGPTGIGKTTTTIKLATNPNFYGRHQVALITIDTYRVAAAAQLKMFSTLTELPLEIAYTPSEFRAALRKFQSYQVILVDTAGRSPLSSDHIRKLQQFMEVATPDEVHMVLSVSTRSDNSLDAAKSFGALPVNRLIFSKLDETPRIGNIVNVARKVNLPISFLTIGQTIPDDIIAAEDEFIMKSIFDTN